MTPMLHEIFYWVLNMSITASITGVLIVLVRQIRAIPRRLTIFLWLVPFFRLTIPFGANSPYSLMTLLSKLSTKTIVVYVPTEGVSFSMTNHAMAAGSYFPISYRTNILEDIFRTGSVIWLVVACALCLMLIFAYAATMREIKGAVHLRDSLYLSEKISSPGVYGIVKPKILLPAFYQENAPELVLLHEKTHIRGAHNLWRMLALLTVVLHWFNPFCWWFLKGFLADLELVCDEKILNLLGETRRKEYAQALLDCKQKERLFASSFGGAKLRTRIQNILSFRRLTWFSLPAFSVLIGIISYVLLTNAG